MRLGIRSSDIRKKCRNNISSTVQLCLPIRRCLYVDVAQMTTIRFQRRASAAHLAGLSILSQQPAALTGLVRQRNVSVLINAFLTRDVLLSSGVVSIAAGIIETVIINVIMLPMSHSLNSSESVILCQVRDVSNLLTVLFHCNSC